jgi:hypothetical protein
MVLRIGLVSLWHATRWQPFHLKFGTTFEAEELVGKKSDLGYILM